MNHDFRALRRRTYFTVVPVTMAGVLLLATAQLGLVLRVPLAPLVFVTPVVIGAVFGTLIARLLIERAIARFMAAEVAEREQRISRLNVELEDRVRQRTAELEANMQALLHSQKMETLGRIAGGIAHDMNNMLTVVFTVTDLLRLRTRQCGGDGVSTCAQLVSELGETAQRARGLTSQLLALSRGSVVTEVVDLRAVVERSTTMLRRVLPADIAVQTDLSDEPSFIVADAVQLEQLLLNLAVNARDAMPGGGTLCLSLRASATEAVLLVTDSGAGMDDATRERAFEPFFTTKAAGRGTGLGLSIVAEVVRRASGKLELRSQLGHGTTFTFRFPSTAPPQAAANSKDASPPPVGHGETICVVEDDDAVRRQIVAALERANYRVLHASGAAEAKAVWAANAGSIHCLVCDVVLAGESGPSLVRRLQASGPRVPVLFMSGYSDQELDDRGGIDGAPLLAKPFAVEELLPHIAKLLRG